MSRVSVKHSFRLYLLGAFRLESRQPHGTYGRESKLIRLPRRKVESLFAYLALHRGPHAREKLAALFWAESGDARARHSLRTSLATLRLHLGNEILATEGDTVELNPDVPLWVDADEMERLKAVDSISGLESLVSLYSGDLLSAFYDDWIGVERERLRNLYLDALLELTQRMRASSDYERAVEFARQVLRHDRANERAHQHLMFCYLALGDRTAALRQYEECEHALREELAASPAPETTALQEWIKQSSGEFKRTTARITNLPIPLSSFIGRQAEIRQVKELVARTRLLTLIGAGGSGKTRLAIQVATDLVDSFQDGVWWVELASLGEASLVAQTVAKALGVIESPSETLSETVPNYLSSKQLLLVLDNCEHLITSCAQLAATLLSAAPNLKILATSREALGITGEWVYHVPTLSVPSPKEFPQTLLLMQYEGIRLFVERATAVNQKFALTEQNALAVAQICQRLDGIPLALELAAARTKLLTPEHIAARLDDRLDLLTQGSQSALPRQQTLRATIDWSYDLLSEDDKKLFRHLAVFAGGFTLDAAQAVYADESLASSAALNELARLVDRSLVLVEQEGGNERYRMLETIREYSDGKLRAAGESDEFRNRHLEFFLNLAEEAEPKLTSAGREVWLGRLESEHANLRAALEWAQENDKPQIVLRLAARLTWFWYQRGYLSEAQSWLTIGLARGAATCTSDEEIADRAGALFGMGLVLNSQGNNTSGKPLLEESEKLWRALGANGKHGLGLTLVILGAGMRAEGDPLTARAVIEQAVKLFREQHDQWGLAYALSSLGLAIRDQEDFTLAGALLEESVTMWREMEDKSGLGVANHYLGLVAYRKGDYPAAFSFFSQALTIHQELGDKGGETYSLQDLALTALNQGEDLRARALFEESVNLARELGVKGNLATAFHFYGYLAMFEGDAARAQSFFEQSLPLALEWGAKWICAMDVGGLGGVAAVRGEYERAARLWGAAVAQMKAVASFLDAADRRFFECTVAKARDALGEARFEAARAEGRAMKFERAVEYALRPEGEERAE